MDILIILIPVTLIIALIGLGFFIWQIKNDQYDDIEGSASRAIFDEDDLNS
jgi:cbb3-type cytochrome oxidase maturation protein